MIQGLKVELPPSNRCKACGHDIATVGPTGADNLTVLLCAKCAGLAGTMRENGQARQQSF
jgi:hypothetical protein